MTQKRNTKRALFTSALSLLLCFAMLIGTTLAWFTDSISSGSNVITSGNLDIDVQYSLDGENWKDLSGAMDLFSKGLWEPGHTEVVALKIVNKGSLALKYNASMSIFSETPGVNKAGEEFKLSEYLKVSSLTMDGGAIGDVLAAYAFQSEDSIWTGITPVGFNSMALGQEGIILEKDQTSYTILKVDMPETVGNEANHNGTDKPSIEFGINVVATQYMHEEDTFGKDYDKNATFEQLADPSISAVESKLLEAGADSIKFAVSTNGFNLAKVTVPASAIADTTAPVTVSFDGMNPADTITMGTNTKAYAFDIKVSNLKDDLAGDQLVTVEVTAPYALPMMKAYHNGEEISATYDEVVGTITFKTANFSPFAFTTEETTVYTLAELREAVKTNNIMIKLGANLTVDLGTDTGAIYTAQNSGGDGYYYTKEYKNGVIVSGQNVAIDLNGYKITVNCDTDKLGDAGALFFVDPAVVGSSLNIIDQSEAQSGTIEMKASTYMVWANEDPTGDNDGVEKTVNYDVDIYSGKFVSDSYAGDPVAPGGANYAENSNRALVYAGNGGTINVYGGYFLYDNTSNKAGVNSNNGAFNVMTHVTTPCITLHDGVMLSNEFYKQANGTDDDSIVLANGCSAPASVNNQVTINGANYSVWYKVSGTVEEIVAVVNNKTTYLTGNSFDKNNIAVVAIYVDGCTRVIPVSECTVSTPDMSKGGIKTISVTYAGVTGTCEILVVNTTEKNYTNGGNVGLCFDHFGINGTNTVFGLPDAAAVETEQKYTANVNGANVTYSQNHDLRVDGSVAGRLYVQNAPAAATYQILGWVGYKEAKPIAFVSCYDNDFNTMRYLNSNVFDTPEMNAGIVQNDMGGANAVRFLMDVPTTWTSGKHTITFYAVFDDGIQKLTTWTIENFQ